MLPMEWQGLIQPNLKGGVHTEVIRTKPQKEVIKKYLSKKGREGGEEG